MSAIEKHILDVLDLSTKRNEDRADFLTRVVKEINAADDATYNKLGKGDQGEAALTWFDAACDAIEGKKPVPDFPDAKKAEEPEEKTTSRRRSSSKDEAEAPAASGWAEGKAKEGDTVRVTSKRDKVIEGKVVEVDEDVIVVDTGDGEEELQLSRQAKVEIKTEGKKTSSRTKDAEADEPADPLKVGAEVKVVNKRGKEFTGKVVELDEEVLVIETSDGEEEFQRSRIESVTVVGGKSKSKAKDEDAGEEKTTSRRRSSSKDEGAGEGDEDKGGRASAGVGVQVRQLLVDALAEEKELPSKEDFLKLAKKKFPDSKDNTLGLIYGEIAKLIDMLKAAKLLKL